MVDIFHNVLCHFLEIHRILCVQSETNEFTINESKLLKQALK